MNTVGIPRGLAYYAFFPFWKAFLETLEVTVVTSSPTTKRVLDQGVLEANNDLCVPVKVFFGHIDDLRTKVDRIFIPRMVSLNRDVTFCPKFLGLPEMVRYGMENLPELLCPRVDLGNNPFGLLGAAKQVAAALGKGAFPAWQGVYRARQEQKVFDRFLQGGLNPREAIALMEEGSRSNDWEPPLGKGVVAVLGYPYSIYDNYLNGNLLDKLTSLEVKVLTPEMITFSLLRQEARRLPKNLFWHFSNRVLWAGLYYCRRKEVDGIIHISNFACGPDAMVNKLLEQEATRWGLPFLTITLDEHTGQAGIHTRLEAFVDMVLWRRRSQ